jgi:hypothetical protein
MFCLFYGDRCQRTLSASTRVLAGFYGQRPGQHLTGDAVHHRVSVLLPTQHKYTETALQQEVLLMMLVVSQGASGSPGAQPTYVYVPVLPAALHLYPLPTGA